MGPLLIAATLAALPSTLRAEVQRDCATKRVYLKVALAKLAQKARELFGRQMSPIIREIAKRLGERLFGRAIVEHHCISRRASRGTARQPGCNGVFGSYPSRAVGNVG